MNIQQRADTFTTYVGLELKGAIVARGHSATALAHEMKRSPAAFNRWLNGKSAIPLTVLLEASELIGVDPTKIVEGAYDRLCNELGEKDGFVYDDGAEAAAATPFGANVTQLHPADDLEDSNITLTEEDELRYAADTSEHDEPID